MYSENYSRQTALASAQKALDPNLTDNELATLSRSDEAHTRAVVAERERTPLTCLIRLSEDVSPAVRAGVARNPRVDIPDELRKELAKDKAPEVLFALIKNESVPDSVIAKLARSRQRDVAKAALARLSKKGAAARMLGMVGIAAS